MRWWLRLHNRLSPAPPPRRDAAEVVQAAETKLAAVAEQTTAVEALVARMVEIRRRNHLAELVRAAWGGRR